MTTPPVSHNSPVRILVIDDSHAVRELVASYLQSEGYQVDTAVNGLEGWQIIQQYPPDLVISDWSMPDLSGIELCRRVRQDPGLQHVYFLMLTAREELSDRILGLDNGADEVLTKPIHPEELRARVRAGLRLRQLTENLVRLNEQLRSRHDLLSSLSFTDPLTGLLREGALNPSLSGLLRQVEDRSAEFVDNGEYVLYYRYLSLWLVEIDQAQKLLDQEGAVVFNQILQIVSRRLQGNALPGTLLYRSSDYQFAAVTPGIDPGRVRELGENLRLAVASHPVRLPQGDQIQVTVSLGGITASASNQPKLLAADMLREASIALYRARIGGRNRCIQSEVGQGSGEN